jgi:adenylate cyclase
MALMVTEGFKRRLAAIVASDLVDYSRLMGQDEAGTLSRLKEYRKSIVDPKIIAHSGRIVKLTGDGMLMEFRSITDAVMCAVEIKEAVALKGAADPPDSRFRFRIGINLGDVILDGDDIYGDGVNIAARLEALAEPGEILVSEVVMQQVGGRAAVRFEDLGEPRLKNIAQTVRVFRIVPVSAEPQGLEQAPFRQRQERLAIAVLPFDNVSPGEAVAELCLGLPESIITGLSRLRWLSVSARNSSFAATESGRDLSQLATRLGVHYLLEGSVQKRGSRLRVTAQLIDAHGGSHLWAQHYDSSTDDLFALQDELTQKIVAAIEQTLVTATVRLSSAADSFAEAPLRRANRLHRSLGRQDNADAQGLLRELIASPNASVAAYQLLANTLELTIDCFWAEDPATAAAEALAVSQKAVQLAPLDYLSNYVLGRALLHSGRHDLAIAAARRSVELNPNSGTSLGGLGGVLAFAGDAEEATAMSERGFRLSPPEPYTALWIWYAAVAAFRLQQFETALRHAETGILVKPDVATGHLLRAIACCGLSRFTDAKASIQDACTWNQSLSLSRLAKYMPYRYGADLEKTIEALREAGMPITPEGD